jgi:putative transposase
MYRILEAEQCVRERRQQLRHPNYTKPELLATAPNQVWSWDITKLLGPRKWTHFHLYVLLDIFSRYVVGWMVASRESAELAQRLIREACERNHVTPDQLTIHSDRGPSMTSKPLALLYADLGIVRSLSRPHTSNDNPFSEAQFKTLKYRPDFPDRFGSIEDARAHAGALLDWYNNEHRHSSLALLTPADVHQGRVDARLEVRDRALDAAFAQHPERFVLGPPKAPRPPANAWINPPPRNQDQQPQLPAGAAH